MLAGFTAVVLFRDGPGAPRIRITSVVVSCVAPGAPFFASVHACTDVISSCFWVCCMRVVCSVTFSTSHAYVSAERESLTNVGLSSSEASCSVATTLAMMMQRCSLLIS
jgi:hypothetical protein